MGKCVKCQREMPYDALCLSCASSTTEAATPPVYKVDVLPSFEQAPDGSLALKSFGVFPSKMNIEVIRTYKKPRFTVAIDIDGVFLNAVEAWMKAYCKKTGKPPFEIDTWMFGDKIGMAVEEVVAIFEEINPSDVEICDEYAPAILEWLDTFAEVYFLTAKTPAMMVWTNPIMERYTDRPIIRLDHDRKWETEFDVLIDDKPDTVKECLKKGRRALLYLCKQNINAAIADRELMDNAVHKWHGIIIRVAKEFADWIHARVIYDPDGEALPAGDPS